MDAFDLEEMHTCTHLLVIWTVLWSPPLCGTSQVVRWLSICLPTQGTRVPSLVWEDSIHGGATKPVCRDYWAHMPPLLKAVCPKASAPQEKPPPRWKVYTPQLESSPHSPQLEKAHTQQRRPSSVKTKKINAMWGNLENIFFYRSGMMTWEG